MAAGASLALAAQAARIQTIGAARETLGYASRVLHLAYEATELVGIMDAVEGSAFQAGVNKVFGITASIRDELRSSIEIARAYVEGIYATYAAATPDLYDEEISTLNSTRVAFALQRSLSALDAVAEEVSSSTVTTADEFVDGVKELLDKVITKVAEAAQSIAQGAANAAASVVSAFAVPLAVAGGVVVLVIAWRSGFLGRPGGGT